MLAFGIDVITEGLLNKGVSCVGFGGTETGVKADAGLVDGLVVGTGADALVAVLSCTGKVDRVVSPDCELVLSLTGVATVVICGVFSTLGGFVVVLTTVVYATVINLP